MTPLTYGYFGEHRSGSTWIVDVLHSICRHVHIGMPIYGEEFGPERGHDVLVVDVNADVSRLEVIRTFRAFHVIRDPRDGVVSTYSSHKYSLPDGQWLAEQRALLDQESLKDAVNHSIDFRSEQFPRLAEWNYVDSRVYETKFENLIEDPPAGFRVVLSFLDLFLCRITPPMLDEVLDYYTFQRLSGGRRRGQEVVFSHYRRGSPGDWRSYFGPRGTSYFKERHRNPIDFPGLRDRPQQVAWMWCVILHWDTIA